jgi:hypothetical protein
MVVFFMLALVIARVRQALMQHRRDNLAARMDNVGTRIASLQLDMQHLFRHSGGHNVGRLPRQAFSPAAPGGLRGERGILAALPPEQVRDSTPDLSSCPRPEGA